MIGHNSRVSLAEAAQANIETGVLLLCKEALITAIQDRRLHRGHLHVLAAIATFMSSRTAKAWPGRAGIASFTGQSLKSVSNLLLELRGFGYLIAEKEAVAEVNNKRLTVYTFGNIDHETIRNEITKFVAAMREGTVPEVPSQWEVPPGREHPTPTGQSHPSGKQSPAPAGTATDKVPPQRVGKSHPGGDSNSMKGTQERERKSDTYNSMGHGLTFDGEVITHKDFAICLEAVRMQAALDPSLPDVNIEDVCKATALQWAVAIEAGQPPHVVAPRNVVGVILGGIRKGQYARHEHAARVSKIASKPKLSRW